MADRVYGNNAATTTAGAIADTDTSTTITSDTNFPTLSGGDWYIATLDDGAGNIEIVKVTAQTGTTISAMDRAQEGTVALNLASGVAFEIRDTASSYSTGGGGGGGGTVATWTPVVTCDSTAGTGTYSVQEGTYINADGICHFQMRIVMSAHTGTGNLQVSLPVASASGITQAISINSVYSTGFTMTPPAFAKIDSATSIMKLHYVNGNTDNTVAGMTAGTLIVSGSYFT